MSAPDKYHVITHRQPALGQSCMLRGQLGPYTAAELPAVMEQLLPLMDNSYRGSDFPDGRHPYRIDRIEIERQRWNIPSNMLGT